MPLPALLGPALASFAPALLSKIFGGDPQKKLRQQIQRLLASQGKLTNQLYQQNLASPAFSQAQGSIAAGANVAGGNLARELGARGIGTSGSAAVLSSLIPSLVGSQQAGLRTSAFQSAEQAAKDRIQQEIATLMGTSGPSQTQQLFGVGLESILPFLMNYFGKTTPGGGGAGNLGSRVPGGSGSAGLMT